MKTAESAIHTRSTLQENPEAYRILVEMPGVTKEGVAVEVEDGILTIQGKKVFLPPSLLLAPSLKSNIRYPHVIHHRDTIRNRFPRFPLVFILFLFFFFSFLFPSLSLYLTTTHSCLFPDCGRGGQEVLSQV